MFFSDISAFVVAGAVAVPAAVAGVGLMERRPRLAAALFCGGLVTIGAVECLIAVTLLL